MNNDRTNCQNSGNTSQKPVAAFRDGGISVAVWRREHEGREFFSLSLKKSYRKGEEWQEERISLYPGDMARALCLLGEGYRHITARERQAA